MYMGSFVQRATFRRMDSKQQGQQLFDILVFFY